MIGGQRLVPELQEESDRRASLLELPASFKLCLNKKHALSSRLSQGCTNVCERSDWNVLCCFSFFPTFTTPAMSPSCVRLMPKQIHKCLQFGQCFQFSLIFSVTLPGGSLCLGQRLFSIAHLPHYLRHFSIAVNMSLIPEPQVQRHKTVVFCANCKMHRKTPIFVF